MRRRAKSLGGAALVALVLPALHPGPGSAVEVPDSGWWWRAQQQSIVPIPAPPIVPPSGLYLSVVGDEPSAVAAVRYRLGEGEVPDTLRLLVGEDSEAGTGVVYACRTTGEWSNVSAGAWAERPTWDADACVEGTRSDAGDSWSFRPAALVMGSVLDVVLVPTSEATYSVAFEAPSTPDLTLQSDPGPTHGETESPPTTTVWFPTVEHSPTVSLPLPAPTVDVPVPTTTPTTVLEASRPASAGPPFLDDEDSGLPGPNRLLASLALLIGLACTGLLVGRGDVVRRWTVPAAAGAELGLGRFRRARDGEAPEL